MVPLQNLSAFAVLAALVAITPGMSTAVVIRNAAAAGHQGGVVTAAGIAIANASWALASVAGLAALLRQSPDALDAIRVAGAVCLVWLGARSLMRAADLRRTGGGASVAHAGAGQSPQPSAAEFTTRAGRRQSGAHAGDETVSRKTMAAEGIVTNLTNPAVPLLYVGSIPQFVPQGPGFAPAFLIFAATHVAIAFGFHCGYGAAFSRIATALAARGRIWIVHAVSGLALVGLALQSITGLLP